MKRIFDVMKDILPTNSRTCTLFMSNGSHSAQTLYCINIAVISFCTYILYFMTHYMTLYIAWSLTICIGINKVNGRNVASWLRNVFEQYGKSLSAAVSKNLNIHCPIHVDLVDNSVAAFAIASFTCKRNILSPPPLFQLGSKPLRLGGY